MTDKRTKKITYDPQRLEYVLKARKITRAALCERIGYAYSNYQKWKKDGRISFDALESIAEELNVCREYLRGFDLIVCTSKITRQADAVQDPSGRYIRPYQKKDEAASRRLRELFSVNEDFESWVNGLPLLESVNDRLIKAGQDPAKPEEISDMLGVLLSAYEEFLKDYLYKQLVYNIQLHRLSMRDDITPEEIEKMYPEEE